MDAFPLTPAGKVDKRALAQQATEVFTATRGDEPARV